jgi:hypothetical protein
VYRAFVVMMLTIALSGCALFSRKAPPEDIDKAAGLFVKRLNAQDYDKIYEDVARKFKKAKTKSEILESLKELGERGKILDHRRTSMSFADEGSDMIAQPVYSAHFEKGFGDLILSFLDEGGEWKLYGFSLKIRG